jgi:hypothetical protein
MEAGAELVKSVKHTRNNPVKDSDLDTLGAGTAQKWLQQPQFTLLWITPAQHQGNVTNFASTLDQKLSTHGGRKGLTQDMSELNTDIEEGIKRIKNFLVFKYQPAKAQSYYPEFGIVHKGKNYIFPNDRDERKKALPLVINAITKYGFTDDKYNLAFWQGANDSYNTLLGQANEVDGAVSQKVSSKNELRKTIVKTHNALINLLKANYPDTYKAVMREWGFQKEKY